MVGLREGLISLLKACHLYEKPEPVDVNRKEVIEASKKRKAFFTPKIGIDRYPYDSKISNGRLIYEREAVDTEALNAGRYHYCGVVHDLNDPNDFCVEDLYLPEQISVPWSYGSTTWLREQKSRLETANQKMADELIQLNKKLNEKSQAYQKLLTNFRRLWNEFFDSLPASERDAVKKGIEDRYGSNKPVPFPTSGPFGVNKPEV